MNTQRQSKVRVFVTPHAAHRCTERGADIGAVAATARRAARQVIPRLTRSTRFAVDNPAIPEVLSVVEVSPSHRKATVKTVLPPDASLAGLEVIRV